MPQNRMLAWADYFKILIALLVIVDPLGAIPPFVAMAGNQSEVERKRIAWVASIAVTAVLAMSALIGESLLRFFGITIASFKVGGAILIMLMALSMLQARQVRDKQTPEEELEAVDKEQIAVVPLAIPLLAGPGAISAVIIYAAEAQGIAHLALIIAACFIVGGATWLALRAATPVARLLGKTGINIAVRLMGIVLAALAVEIFASGIVVLLPGLR
jgi:multiple antibiotic resistance protein